MMRIFTRFFRSILAGLALFSFELLLVVGIFLVSLVVFVLIWRKFIHLDEDHLDYQVFQWLQQYISGPGTAFFNIITFLASRYFLMVACLILTVYFLFIRKHKWFSVKIPVVAIGGISINVLMKQFFQRPRPADPLLAEASGLSFPSGHAMLAVSFYGLLIYLIWRNVENTVWRIFFTALLVVLIHLIGFSRIYLRVHYTSDVIAGFAVGGMWIVVSLWVLRKLEKYSGKKIDPMIKEEAE